MQHPEGGDHEFKVTERSLTSAYTLVESKSEQGHDDKVFNSNATTANDHVTDKGPFP